MASAWHHAWAVSRATRPGADAIGEEQCEPDEAGAGDRAAADSAGVAGQAHHGNVARLDEPTVSSTVDTS
jgi:hypothetical protein